MKEVIKAEFNEIYVVNENDIEKLQKTEIEINTLTMQANQMALSYVIAIGRKLKEAKEMVNFGQWGEWCSEKINYSQSTAENYIKIYEEYGSEQLSLLKSENSETIMNLPYSKALALIAVPSDEREDFVKENNVESLSVRELKNIIKQKETDEEGYINKITALEEEKVKASAAIVEKENKIKELEEQISQAEDVAADDNELKKLRADIEKATKKEYEEKIKKLKSEKAELEETVKNKDDQINEIKNDSAAAISRLEEENKEAENKIHNLKNVSQSSGILQVINAHLESFQECFDKLKYELDKLKTENKEGYEKIKNGIIAIISEYETNLKEETE